MGCIRLGIFLASLAVAAASIAVLVAIGGKSDGPGALLFYIGAFAGFAGAWVAFASGPPPDA